MATILHTVTSSAVNKNCVRTMPIIKTTRLLRLQSRLLPRLLLPLLLILPQHKPIRSKPARYLCDFDSDLFEFDRKLCQLDRDLCQFDSDLCQFARGRCQFDRGTTSPTNTTNTNTNTTTILTLYEYFYHYCGSNHCCCHFA